MKTELEVKRRRWTCGWSGLVVLVCLVAQAGDWPAYRGPGGDGICPEPIRTDWPAEGPSVLWRQPLTDGFGSVSVVGDRVFTLVLDRSEAEPREVCLALDGETGAIVWSADVGPGGDYQGGPAPEAGGSDGPRSTPVWHQGRVYVLATYLLLSCLDAATGEVVWTKDVRNELEAYLIPWHSAASPVIADGVLLVSTGQWGRSVVGLDPADGAVLWRNGFGNYTHATPVPTSLGGQSQVIFLTWEGLQALDPQSGREVWRYPLAFNRTSVGASPVVVGDIVYCSAAYGTGAGAARIAGNGPTLRATEIWRKVSSKLMNHWMTPVAHDGHVYGYYGQHKYRTAPLQCVNAETGEVRWGEDGFGHGGLLLVGDQLLAVTDRGEVVLADASPEAYRERARFRAIQNGVVWNAPAISNGRLFVRGTREIAAFDVALPPPAPLRLTAVKDPAGELRLEVRGQDQGPVEADRADRLALETSPDLGQPPANWTVLDIEWLWDQGTLSTTVSVEATADRQYFRLREQ